MSAKKSSPEMSISVGCEFGGDNLMPPLEGIIWQCSSCISLARHCAILFQEESFAGNNFDIDGNFHISLCSLKGLSFASFTRAEFYYCSSALHWQLHGRGRDLKDVKRYCELMQGSDTYFSSCYYLFIIALLPECQEINISIFKPVKVASYKTCRNSCKRKMEK